MIGVRGRNEFSLPPGLNPGLSHQPGHGLHVTGLTVSDYLTMNTGTSIIFVLTVDHCDQAGQPRFAFFLGRFRSRLIFQPLVKSASCNLQQAAHRFDWPSFPVVSNEFESH